MNIAKTKLRLIKHRNIIKVKVDPPHNTLIFQQIMARSGRFKTIYDIERI